MAEKSVAPKKKVDGGGHAVKDSKSARNAPAMLPVSLQLPGILQRAQMDPDSLDHDSLIAMQSAVGLRATQRLLAGVKNAAPRAIQRQTNPRESLQRLLAARGTLLQARLTVGAADDPYEREADRVATQVMSANSIAADPIVARKEDEQTTRRAMESPAITPLAQHVVARTADLSGSFDAGHEVERQLSANSRGGRPLPEGLRAELEPKYGADFESVRVHTGAQSDQLNRTLGAQAFTHSNHIYMADGKYDPGTGAGKRLLAHELTHVIQQTGGPLRRSVKRNRGAGRSGPGQQGSVQRHLSAYKGAGVIQRVKGIGPKKPVKIKHYSGTYDGVIDSVVNADYYLVNTQFGPKEIHEQFVFPVESDQPLDVKSNLQPEDSPKLSSLQMVDQRPLFRLHNKQQNTNMQDIMAARMMLDSLKHQGREPKADAVLLCNLWDILARIPFKYGRVNLDSAFPNSKLVRFITKMGFVNLVRELRTEEGVIALDHSGQLAEVTAEVICELEPILLVFQAQQMKTTAFDPQGEQKSLHGELQTNVRNKQLEIERIKNASLGKNDIERLREKIKSQYAIADARLSELTKRERFVRQDIEDEERHKRTTLLNPEQIAQLDQDEREFPQYRYDNAKVPLETKKKKLEQLKAQLKSGNESVRKEVRLLQKDIDATETFDKTTLHPDAVIDWDRIVMLTKQIERRNKRISEIAEERKQLNQPPVKVATSSEEKKEEKPKEDPSNVKVEKMKAFKLEEGRISKENSADEAEITRIKKERGQAFDIEYEAFRMQGKGVDIDKKRSTLTQIQQELESVSGEHEMLKGIQSSGLDNRELLEESAAKARIERDAKVEKLNKEARAKTVKFEKEIGILRGELDALTGKRIKEIGATQTGEPPQIEKPDVDEPLSPQYLTWFAYLRHAFGGSKRIEPNADDEAITAKWRKLGQQKSALGDIPEKTKSDIVAANAGLLGFEERLSTLKGNAKRMDELVFLESQLHPELKLLTLLGEARTKLSKVTLKKLQAYQLDFEARTLVSQLNDCIIDLDASLGEGAPEQLLVLCNFSGFIAERMSETLQGRLDQVLSRAFRGALKDLRNRAVHFFDTGLMSLLHDKAISIPVLAAARALNYALGVLKMHNDFLTGKDLIQPKPDQHLGEILRDLNAAVQALPKIELDFDANGGPKPPAKEEQERIFNTAVQSAPLLIQEICILVNKNSLKAHDVVALFQDPPLKPLSAEQRKLRLLIESRLQALGQTIGNLQQLDETLTALGELNIPIGQIKHLEQLHDFVAMAKEFRSARTHSGFTNMLALMHLMTVILDPEKTGQIISALEQLHQYVTQKAPFTSSGKTEK